MIAESLRDLAVPIERLAPMPGNPRRGDVAAVARSLERFGQRKPVVARRDGTVLAGNHVLAAARQLGWSELAVTWADDDDATARAFALADNRTAEFGTFDLGDLAAMAAEVFAADPGLLEAASYTEADLNALLAGVEVPPKLTDPDEVPEPPAEPVTKPGDLWLLGPHRLLVGDCRDTEALDRLMEGQTAHLVVTSPPYASQRAYDEASGFEPILPDRYGEWFGEVANAVWAVLAEDGSFLLNLKAHADDGERHLYVMKLVIQLREQLGWRFIDEFCWVDAKNGVPGAWANRFKDAWEPVYHFAKTTTGFRFDPLANATDSAAVFDYSPANEKSATGSGLLGKESGRTPMREGLARPSNVLRIASSSTSGHEAAYPVDLPAWFIRALSHAGDRVLDPFMGSGSTLIAAHREGRICRGVEISPRYADVAARRYQEHTGTKPILEATGEPHDFTAG